MTFTHSFTEADHDRRLIQCILSNNDEEAFTDIVVRYRDRMFLAASRFLKSREDAEEVAQDTFIRARKGLPHFRNDSSLSTWLHIIAFNLARNKFHYNERRMSQCTLSLQAPLGEDTHATLADCLASDERSPVDEYDLDEFSVELALGMTRLNPRYRNILTMRCVENLRYEEIAQRLGIRVGTVKSRIARARKSLRERLCPELV